MQKNTLPAVEMCAIYKCGSDDALRVNVFFLLSVQFDAFCFLLVLAATIWCAWFCPFRLLFNFTCFHVFFLLLFSSSYIFMLRFLLRVYIVMASLLNGMLDILLDFHDVCPWYFIYFISLSSFYCRDI